MLKRLFLLVLLALGPLATAFHPVPVAAQQAIEGPDYVAWEKIARRAETAAEEDRASAPALEAVRDELVQWREQFIEAQGANKSTIATVRAQLEALGSVPEDGTETDEVAAQRAELNRRLAELEAPVKTAELAHSRAEGVIKAIDQVVRDRQTKALLQLGPSPLHPEYWGDGVNAIKTTISAIRTEIVNSWTNPAQNAITKAALPGVILGLLIGLVLMVRGRRWSEWLAMKILRGQESGAGRWMISFLVSMGGFILPFAGVYIAIEAIYVSGLIGLRGDVLLGLIPPSAFIFLLTRWLASRIFPRHELREPPLRLTAFQRRSGRLYCSLLGLVVAAFYLLKQISDIALWPKTASVTILFAMMVLSALLLGQVSRLLIAHARASHDETADEEEAFRDQLFRWLARSLQVLAVVAPLLAAIGYSNAAQALMFPSLLSLILLGLLLILQRMLSELYALLSGNQDGASESLVPVLAGFVLVVLSFPVFALIWGVRLASLAELWTHFVQGVSVGGTHISPVIFLTLAVVFVIGYLLTRLLQGTLRNSILPRTKIDAGARNAIVSGVGYLGIFLAALVAITSAGIDLSNIALVAGALSVGIGFGLQNIVSNFVSGIILLIERPISEGDWIEVGGVHGTVRDISVRSTRIETFDRSDVIVPNADFVSGRVTNYTRGNTVGRVIVPVGVAYGSDTRQVERVLLEIATEHPMVLANPAPYVVFQGFGADSLDFEIRAILRDVNWVLTVHSDMNHEIARRFTDEDIEIPFAQRDVWLRNPEVLKTSPKPEPKAPRKAKPAGKTAKAPVAEGDMPEADPGAGDGADR